LLAGMFVAVLGLVSTLRGAEPVEADRPVELKPLDRWIGEWDMEASVKPTEREPQGVRSTFRTSIAWAVNGRFLRCDAQGSGQAGERKFKDAFLWIATYDPSLKAYTSTVFWANVTTPTGPSFWGGGIRAVGDWDEKAKTLTSKAVDPGNGWTMATVTTWTDADTHGFVSTLTDAQGKVMMEMSGRATRRKKG
jgi:hypothetical protein